MREVERFPFVPSDDARLNELCFEAYNIQSHGLRKRLESARVEKIVIGVSGGLDSTQALLVCAQTFDALGLPRSEHPRLHAAGLRHQQGHQGQCLALMAALGVTAQEIDMTPACRQMLVDIGHPFAKGEPSTTSPSRTCRPARAPPCCSASPTRTTGSCSARAISRSWRWAGAPMASATTCRITTSTARSRRR
jgi:hypothetical protein